MDSDEFRKRFGSFEFRIGRFGRRKQKMGIRKKKRDQDTNNSGNIVVVENGGT